jgi:hypothetical protein
LFSTVSIAGFTFPLVMSIVASLIVAFAGAAFPPKLICLKNQLEGRFLASVLLGVTETWGGGGCGGGTGSDFLTGECARLEVVECVGLG